jgi:hypothetical protein
MKASSKPASLNGTDATQQGSASGVEAAARHFASRLRQSQAAGMGLKGGDAQSPGARRACGHRAANDARRGAVGHGGPADDHRRRAAGTCRHMMTGAAGPRYGRLPRPHAAAPPPLWPSPLFGGSRSAKSARDPTPEQWGGQRVWKFYRVTAPSARLSARPDHGERPQHRGAPEPDCVSL